VHWVILGAGALGSILAAHLARAGEDVTLLARGARARLLQAKGLSLTGPTEMNVPVRVLDDPSQVSRADVLALTVKSYDTRDALSGVSHIQVDAAFSVQNGIVKDEQLGAVFGPAAVVGAAADFSGEVLADGRVRFTRNEGLYLGELPTGTSGRVKAMVAALNNAGVKAIESGDILSIEWSKFVSWLSITAQAVLTRLDTDVIMADPDLSRLQWRLAKEAALVSERLGVPLMDMGGLASAKTMTAMSHDEWVVRSRANAESMRKAGVLGHKISALQDVLNGKRLEVDETFGYVVDKALEMGLETPALDACYRLVSGVSHSTGGTKSP
jgi:2-dehydropantoate 2-reductase